MACGIIVRAPRTLHTAMAVLVCDLCAAICARVIATNYHYIERRSYGANAARYTFATDVMIRVGILREQSMDLMRTEGLKNEQHTKAYLCKNQSSSYDPKISDTKDRSGLSIGTQ